MSTVDNSKPTRTLILAGTMQRAKIIARERGLRPPDWRYAFDVQSLRGIRGTDVHVIIASSFYDRERFDECRDMLAVIESSGVTSSYYEGH